MPEKDGNADHLSLFFEDHHDNPIPASLAQIRKARSESVCMTSVADAYPWKLRAPS